MKIVPQLSGPFRKWPFFHRSEIDHIAADDLRRFNLLPAVPSEIDVDALVHSAFGFSPTYTTPGDGIMGYIRFGPTRPEVIIIDEALADISPGASPTLDHRRRSTIAHETGHGRLHLTPFTELVQVKRTGRPSEWVRHVRHAATFACRQQDIFEAGQQPAPHPTAPRHASPHNWERMAEWQANRYMASVLMPSALVHRAVADLLEIREDGWLVQLNDADCERFAPPVARTFNVSRQFATIRLRELFRSDPAVAEPDLFAVTTNARAQSF